MSDGAGCSKDPPGPPPNKVAKTGGADDYSEAAAAKLECPVCLFPMEPPIYICAQGHSFCGVCEPQLKLCPLCPAKKTKIRNYGLENMTDGVVYPCRAIGCDATFTLDNKSAHNLACVGRIVTCCNGWKGTCEQLKTHVKQSKEHLEVNVELDVFSSIVCDTMKLTGTVTSLSKFVLCDGQILQTSFSSKGDSYAFCVNLYGTRNTSSRYKFEVRLESEKPDALCSTHTALMHTDLDWKPGCCVPLFTKGTPAEKLYLNDGTTQVKLAYKIIRNDHPQPVKTAVNLYLLLLRYPVVWRGLLALKNDHAAVQFNFISGDLDVARHSLRKTIDQNLNVIRIAQRMRLEPLQLEGVGRKLRAAKEHSVLVALPVSRGRDTMDIQQQRDNLSKHIIAYLHQHHAAAIFNVTAPGSQTVAYVIHIFASCEFVTEHLTRLAPGLMRKVSDIAYLFIVIATV